MYPEITPYEGLTKVPGIYVVKYPILKKGDKYTGKYKKAACQGIIITLSVGGLHNE
jgi:hypothetical protein